MLVMFTDRVGASMSRLRNRVRQHREARGLTIVQLAEDIDLSPTTVGKIDREATAPSGRIMLRFADYFGVSVQELFWSEVCAPDSTLNAELVASA